MNDDEDLLHGRCMCGAVRYELTQRPMWMYNCHCGKCRHASGASFVTNVIVAAQALRITQGRERIRGYESSPGKHRYFCGDCGSPLYSHGKATARVVSVRTGTLDEDPGVAPSYHAYAKEAVAWSHLDDGLPRFDGMPDPAFVEDLLRRARGPAG